MDFKAPYLMAMREQAPQMFKELRKAGKMDEHLQQMSRQAHQMLKELLANKPKRQDGHPTNQALIEAEQIVRETLIEFPTEA